MESARLRARFLGRRSLLIAATLAALLAVPLPSSAATITGSWQAKVGSGGANGSASVVSYLTGAGSVTLKLAKLKPATTLPVAIYKGTCSAVGAKVVGLASIKTTSKGAATRTSALTAAQTKAITTAAAAGKMTIRVGSGSAVKCGAFTAQAIAPYVAASVTPGRHPHGVAVAPNGIWVANWWDNTLTRIDPATNTVLQTLPVAVPGTGGPQAVAFGENSIWVTVVDFDTEGKEAPGSLLRVDPSSGQVLATIPVGKGPYDVTVSPGAVWVALFDGSSVVRIDPATNQIAATIATNGQLTGVAFGFGATWAADYNGKVSRIDPATNQITATIQTQDTGAHIVAGGTAVWMANPGHEDTDDGTVTRIDPATNSVVGSVAVGSFPDDIAYADGFVWVALYDRPTVVQISASSTTVANRVTVEDNVYAIAAANHSVWAVHDSKAGDGSSAPAPGRVTRLNY